MSNFKEVQNFWFKATKVGDYMEGTLVNREWKDGVDPQGRPQRQEVYEILTDEGKFHTLIKKDGQKVIDEENPIIIGKGEYYQFAKGSIVAAMKKIKIGQKVKLIFHSVVESKDKMKNDFKLVKVYAGDMDEEYLKQQWGELLVATTDEAPSDDINVKDIPFN